MIKKIYLDVLNKLFKDFLKMIELKLFLLFLLKYIRLYHQDLNMKKKKLMNLTEIFMRNYGKKI
jgi:hypothetical protein